MQLVERVRDIAKLKNCEPAQLALAWLLARGQDIVPIPGTKRQKYLEVNAAAVDIELTTDEFQSIDDVARSTTVAGARYPDASLRAVNR
jgi:aryl-alcohol dehydrogenase-like predicted oxidoreductase